MSFKPQNMEVPARSVAERFAGRKVAQIDPGGLQQEWAEQQIEEQAQKLVEIARGRGYDRAKHMSRDVFWTLSGKLPWHNHQTEAAAVVARACAIWKAESVWDPDSP
jgi:hypothetical protein